MSHNITPERRRFPRFSLLSRASVIDADGRASACVLEDLSRSGAQLSGRTRFEVGETLRVGMHVPARPLMTVMARVVRRQSNHSVVPGGTREHRYVYGLAFLQADRSLDAAYGEDLFAPAVRDASEPLVLVVDGKRQACMEGVQALSALGRHAIGVSNALDAVQWLLHDAEHIDAALVRVTGKEGEGNDLLDYLAEQYPHVRRIAVKATGQNVGAQHPTVALPLRSEQLLSLLS